MTNAVLGTTMLEIDGDGAPVVFVHGLGGTSNSFHAMLSAFGGFRCIRPDLPGSGRSPRAGLQLSIDLFADVIAGVIRSVAGAPAHLVGHSMGTLIAQHVAVSAPDSVRSLTLFGPIGEPGDASRERLRARARLVRNTGMLGVADAAAEGGLSSASKSANPLAAPFLRETHMRQDPEGFAQTCEALASAQAADLRRLRCPVLLVTGDEDAVAPPEAVRALAEKIRGARVKVLSHCGHWTPIELPKECGRLASEHARANAAD